MRTVYASTFDLRPNAQETSESCFNRLLSIWTGWVEKGYQRKWSITVRVDLNSTTNNLNPLPGHIVRWSREKATNCEMATIEWEHPSDNGSDLQWSTVCSLARKDDTLQTSVAVRISSVKPVMKPIAFDIGRPKVIDLIIASTPCFVGGQTISKDPVSLSAAEVEDFVEHELLSTERTLPIVLISPDVRSGHAEVEASDFQKSLLGFAKVVELQDKWAAYSLTEVLGKELSCYNGAVRTYWPGFSKKSNPYDHPLYLQTSIRHHMRNNQPLDRHIFRLLVTISAFRLSDAAVVQSVKSVIEKQRVAHIQSLLAQTQASGNEMKEITDELEKAWDENSQLTKERDQAKQQVSDLTAELEAQKAAWQMVSQAESEKSVDKPATIAPLGEPEFENVFEVVSRVKEDFSQTIQLLDDAEDSAKDSPYQHPGRVFELFQALDELVQRWQKSGTLGESWKAALKSKGFDYKDSISMTSRGKFGEDYKFQYNGKRVLFENHVTIGAKQPESCISVHWILDEAKKMVVVGSCGRHLPNTKT